MGFKSFAVRPFAHWIARQIDQWSAIPIDCQDRIFQQLVKIGKHTAYGKAHHLEAVTDYETFKKHVPVADYEDLRPYIDRIKKGENDVLWKGRPLYFAKTSGTTSGVKYIPLTRESFPNHFNSARNATFYYIAKSGNASFLDGKMIFLSGSPELDDIGGIKTGRLSGIVNHAVPAWLRTNQLPSYLANCIEDWETKLDAIVEETYNQDMRLISGIPPWVQMYYERLLSKTGKQTIKEVFPNLSLFVHGGVNFEPYRAQLETLVGTKLDTLETFPASEGFFGFQDHQDDKSLLLNVNAGIFYEFIPAEEIFNTHPTRLSLQDVKIGVNYAMILNTNAGLWGYNLGDTVEFTSVAPYRLLVTGRVKHFISAFGEHVIGKEVETALLTAARRYSLRIIEFTVAPQVNPPEGAPPYHEWFVEFDIPPASLHTFATEVDELMQQQNIYYQDLRAGNILQTLQIRSMPRDAFRNYMKSLGKLGGQNKVPRLANDRKLVQELISG